MGLRDNVHELSWLIVELVVFTWIALSSAAVTNLTFFPSSGFTLLFVYFFTFSLSLVSLHLFNVYILTPHASS